MVFKTEVVGSSPAFLVFKLTKYGVAGCIIDLESGGRVFKSHYFEFKRIQNSG